ncbi:MAG: lamin tail domain-containing protein, partial [Candidatus Omnitrophica bacterium]|nr:lamin tail domain-containing protein [Candidatus Omnitrophota bacterium]
MNKPNTPSIPALRGLLFTVIVCFLFFFFHVPFLHADWAVHIVISEMATTGTNGAKDEFVELYNPTANAIDIGNSASGYKLRYRSVTSGNWASGGLIS